MPTRYLQLVAPKTRFAVWAWGPVIMLRIALVTIYLLFGYGGIIAAVSGVPILDHNAPAGYTLYWGILLSLSGFVAAIGALTDRWQKVELWASLLLAALMLAYIGGVNIRGFVEMDFTRQFVGVLATISGVLPIARFIYLAAQSGKIHAIHLRK